MKNYIKNLIVTGLATITFCLANPAYATNETKVAEDYNVIRQYYQLEEQKTAINKKLTELKKKIKEKDIQIGSFKPYGKDLTLEDYSRIMDITQKHSIKGHFFEKFVRLERILENESFMNNVSDYYRIDKQDMIRLWNQESNFDIKGIGSHGERGLAQFKELSAKLLFDRLTSFKDSFYFDWKQFYPEFDIQNYDFEQLSEDYKLNMIMTAAQIKLMPIIFENYLKKANMNQKQLIRIIRQKGTNTRFENLREAIKNPYNFNLDKNIRKLIKDYRITDARVAEVHKVYREKVALLPVALEYIVHNGGGGAIENITTDSFISELLIYHLAMYIKNLGVLYDLINCHYGSLESMVKSNAYLLKDLTTDKTIDLWGNEIRKIDLQKLKKYFQHGLIENVNSNFFEKDHLIIIKSHVIDKNLRLQPVDENLIKLLSTANIDGSYEKLIMFKQLEEAQKSLNEAWASKNKEDMNLFGVKVTKLERDINKKFGMKREHTGIEGIRNDITLLEESIKNAGFIPDLEEYSQMTQLLL